LPRTLSSTPSVNVAIVTIDDEDYEKRYQATSPLKQATVIELINAIQFFGPRIVGVDLDTGHWSPPPNLKNTPGRLVWARLFEPAENGPLRIAKLGPVPGGGREEPCWGLTAMQADSDYVIRQYPESVAYEGPPTEGPQVTTAEAHLAYVSFPRVVQGLM